MNEINEFTSRCSLARTEIKSIGKSILELKEVAVMMERPNYSESEVDKPEMIANVQIAYRHLEDAAMRLGKAIQAFETGNSIYDQNDSLRAANLQ